MKRDVPTEVLSFALPPELSGPTFVAIDEDRPVTLPAETGNVTSDRERDARLYNERPDSPAAPEAPLAGMVPLDFVPSSEEELAVALADPMWRICSGQLYKILVKSKQPNDPGHVVPFRPNRAQRRLLRRLWHRNIILKARQLGFCVDPDTRVLTAGLEWARIGDVQPGDEVIGVDEFPPGGKGSARKMRTAVVQAKRVMQAERFRISFDDGRSVVCTANHPWLSRKTGTSATWRSLSGKGNAVTGRIDIGTHVRWVTKPWDAPSVEDGWFGGMLDGEGSMALPSRAGASINVSQRPGPVWDRLECYASARGYHARTEADAAERESKHGTTPVPKLAFTRMDELFRLIGQTRPTRFIDTRWWEGRELPGKRNGDVGWSRVVSIEPLGVGEVVDMQTSTGTYIAEGFVSHNTTLVCIMWLDHALFNANQRCGIVAQDKDAAEAIFRDKVRLAYNNLPEQLREAMPLVKDSASELMFAHNGSAFRVGVSLRSGTYHRLHVSEFGKIGAKWPDKAKEVVTGTLPTVPLDGIAIIESTAEGQEGEFYKMTQQAMNTARSGRELNEKDFRFHFYPWWQEPGYRLKGEVVITDKDREYFFQVEAKTGTTLDPEQRAWYVATRDSEFGGDPEKMWQEYPSFPDEAFQVSTEGCYYAVQMAEARKSGRICRVPHVEGVPVNTFWDIGNSDGTAIWLHQRIGFDDRFIGFIEGWGESYAHFIKELQDTKYLWGTHYLPHDADHKRQQGRRVCSPKDELEEMGLGGDWVIVDRVDEVIHGIQKTRQCFGTYWFDQEKCADGIAHIQNYRKKWDKARGKWKVDDPSKIDGHSEAADALRQHAQGYQPPSTSRSDNGARRNWRTS